MGRYILRRLLLFFPTLVGVSIGVFIVLRVVPGDVASVILGGPTGEGTYTQEELRELRAELGLDKPLYIQYVRWVGQLARGDLGDSYALSRPISGEIKRQFPVSFQLGAFTLIIIYLVAVPIGVVSAVRQDTWVDYVLRGGAVLGLAMPGFFVALLIVLLLSSSFGWLPPIGFVNIWDSPASGFLQLIFPALALGFSSAGSLMRITRTQLLEVLREDYIRTARAKGLRESAIIVRHALRNALLPVVTIAGFQVGVLFSGAVVIEQVFNLPGIGRGLVQGLFSRDLPMIQAYVMYFALVAVVANLVVDLTYAWLDPRIRYE